MRLAQLAEFCDAALLRGDPNAVVQHIRIDSRALEPGDCFVALRGRRFDGHQFVEDAARSGASAAVVSDPTRAMNSPSALALLQVQDTLTALHKLATNHRRLMPPTTRVITVSGACGKTTTKEMIAAVLAERFHVRKSEGNLNNHIGAPLSLLALDPDCDFGVFELGSNHPGEISLLAQVLKPDVGVVTNIGLAHVEFLGDEAGVAQEEGSQLEYLPANGDGLAVLNADDPWSSELRSRTRATVITVGVEQFADLRASNIVINGDVKFRLNVAKKREDVIVRLRTLGRHQIYNALQAAAVGYGLGLDLDEIRVGLESVEYPRQRMEIVDVGARRFVNDSYNANPPSMKAALRMLRETPWPGRKIAVLGDMRELGSHTRSSHLELGAEAARSGLALLLAVGSAGHWLAEGAMGAGMEMHRVLVAESAADATDVVRALVREGDFVLLKGSRVLQLEKILEAVKQQSA